MQLRHTITLLGFITILFQSCADFLDVNDNPNAPVSENLALSAKLPAALVASVNQEQGQLNQLGALWGGYWGTSSEGINSFFHQKNYNGPGMRDVRDGYPVWETTYTTLVYYHLIREQAEQEGEPFYEGVAKIMQGWHFLRLVDIYNNVPFEEALQGTTNSTPSYEAGQDVYQKAVNLITEGISAIQMAPAAQVAGTDDVLFKGNKTLWAKFGNTVKLRALIRQSEKDNAAYINAELAKIAAEGSGFLGMGESALIQPGYLQTAGKMNPFYESYYRNVQQAATANYQDIRPTTYLLEKYTERNDPRLGQLYLAVNGDYNGVVFGDPVVNQALYGRANTSALKGPLENNGQPAGLLKSPTQASVLMGSFESLFLQAEAAQRGWINLSAEELYNAAITESFVYLGLNGAAADEYLNQSEVAYQGTLDQLILQKWLSLNSISSIEAWNDFRRLGMPQFPNSLAINNPSVRPQRLMYPETERMTNLDEVVSQGDDQVTTAKVWWAN
ncbi:SusD/RagB family nutrient-binding outer membrane lipoprotein [Lunatibacter salilacus]|uniref:SusD/RagB family nutrient-binding outer membrane lipoprotein n=1 Tax=Lunatibacter salilacus TaxID=2483804 RepID=UPI00131D647F|nr:SusD/RagB family nutrient-binding outer membrane lipoprotein [Lunatibacter salilacus]